MTIQMVILAVSGLAVLSMATAVGIFLLKQKIQEAKAAKTALQSDQ